MSKLIAIPTKNLTHDQWLNLRYDGLGGSDVAAAMGLSKFKTPTELYLEKVERHDSFEGNAATEWGVRLEDVVARAYAEKTGERIRNRHAILKNPDMPWLFANVDRLVVGKKKGLEVKTASLYTLNEWGEDGSDEVPDYYKTQAYDYMLVTGLRVWDFAVLIGGSDFRTYTVEFDQRIADRIIEETRAFWYDHVLTQTPPPPVNLDDVRRIYRKDAGSEIEADDYVSFDYGRLLDIKAQIKDLTAQENAIKTALGAFMGDHAVLTLGDKKLATFKNQPTVRVDPKLLKSEFPDVYEAVAKTTDSRVLRTY
jgi:putative phage-type endonuclease